MTAAAIAIWATGTLLVAVALNHADIYGQRGATPTIPRSAGWAIAIFWPASIAISLMLRAGSLKPSH